MGVRKQDTVVLEQPLFDEIKMHIVFRLKTVV